MYCIKCKDILKSYFQTHCICGGRYIMQPQFQSFRAMINVLYYLAQYHNMHILKEVTKNLMEMV
jgi:hypothetical protein